MACSFLFNSSCFPCTHPIDSSNTVMYKMKGLPSTSGASTRGFIKYCLIFSSAILQSSLHDVAPCGACRPWIFIINGVLYFLNISGSWMEEEERWLEMPLQGEYESRRSSPPSEAMDKSLKVGEEEWREREKRSKKFCASNEVWTFKCNSQMIKVPKNKHTWPLFIA